MLLKAIAPSSGKEVLLNLHLDRCVVFDFVTKADLESVIQELETKKINTLWDGLFSETMNKQNRTFLKAFISRGNTVTGKDASSFGNFRSDYMRELIGSSTLGRNVKDFIQTRSIDEQKHLLEKCRPKNRAQLEAVLRDPITRFGCDKLALLREFSNPTEYVDYLVSNLSGKPKQKDNLDFPNLLIAFWAKGLILLPQSIRYWNSKSKWLTISNANPQISNTIKQIYKTASKKGFSDRRLSFVASFFATSTTVNRSDLSVELIQEYHKFIDKEVTRQYQEGSKHDFDNVQGPLSDIHKAALALTSAFNDENPNLAIDLASRRIFKKEEEPRKGIKFEWVEYRRPELSEWCVYLYQFLLSFNNAKISTQHSALKHLMNFIIQLDQPPLKPWLVKRKEHIVDHELIHQNTFFNYLLSISEDGKTLKGIISNTRKFFLWLRERLLSENKIVDSQFIDPIVESDKLGIRSSSNQTHRDALPAFLVTEMKDLLIENDFAYPKSYFRNTVPTIDQTTGYSVRIFNPGLAICLYTLLDTPIRSHQARWLDSGFLDEKNYNFSTEKMEYNPSPYAIKSRKEGVLQLSKDSLRSHTWLTMWVNTNKTRDAYKGAGYTIPYVSPKLEMLFKIQIEWSKKYLPEPKTTLNYQTYMQDVREIRTGKLPSGPEITPLFIDPVKPGQKLPYTYYQLARLYTKLLKETEVRVFKKYGQRYKLVTTNDKGKEVWAVDLHSLRVSGITNLIEAGVPIEIVQQFVAGHTTLVMTLHYLKYSPAKLRGFIEEAHRKMQDDQDFVGSESFISAINEFTPYLLSQHEPGTGPGFEALNSGDGILEINTDGICPGTSCSSGYEIRGGESPIYGPVPGGKRCPLCRYWITGPAHLLGQVNAVNNLAFAIRKKGLELVRLNDLKLDAEDSANQQLARGLRDRIDFLNREIELDVAEWTARYKYVDQSLAQMEDYLKAKANIIASDATPRVPMMTSSQPLELKVTLEQAHEFALLDQITQTAVFNPGFPNLHAELEKNQVLSKMMIANGMKPFLLSLSEEQAHEAGNLLSALILQQVDAQDLDEVLTGKKPLEQYPNLASAVLRLEEASNDRENFLPDYLNALSVLIDTPGEDTQSNSDHDDEDLFG
ncbi:VPA1269 family protein [Pseudomonas sivasensis]|uniref:VPA1269 family protein n=1 Tax=Pseudomonas sivasensis TaxID=1880678 RepID=UPI003B9F6273